MSVYKTEDSAAIAKRAYEERDEKYRKYGFGKSVYDVKPLRVWK